MKTHHDLDVWKKSISLVTKIYAVTKSFPQTEIYGLTSQIRRCAVSIPSNIAEGAARSSKNEFGQFLSISLGSLSELETQLIVSNNLKYLETGDFNDLTSDLTSIRRMILGLKKHISKED
jgi:four helix bundle protein